VKWSAVGLEPSGKLTENIGRTHSGPARVNASGDQQSLRKVGQCVRNGGRHPSDILSKEIKWPIMW